MFASTFVVMTERGVATLPTKKKMSTGNVCILSKCGDNDKQMCLRGNMNHQCIIDNKQIYDPKFAVSNSKVSDLVHKVSRANLDCSYEEYFSTFRTHVSDTFCVEAMCSNVNVFHRDEMEIDTTECREWIRSSFRDLYGHARIIGGYQRSVYVPRKWNVRVQLWRDIYISEGYGTIRVLWLMLSAIRRYHRKVRKERRRDALTDRSYTTGVGQCCEDCYIPDDQIKFDDVVDVAQYLVFETVTKGSQLGFVPIAVGQVDQVIQNNMGWINSEYISNLDKMIKSNSVVDALTVSNAKLVFKVTQSTKCLVIQALQYCNKCVTYSNVEYYYNCLERRLFRDVPIT